MKGVNQILIGLSLLTITSVWLACNKPADGTIPPYNLSYGDSILYLKPSGNNIIYPMEHRSGTYTAFPEGIEVDENTGAINLDNSETGLRYRITHTAPDGTKTEAKVVLSGITFTDKFYHLSTGDSIAPPVYNASVNRVLPLSGSNFDEGNVANGGGCSVRTDNGKINLAESIRNGVFGSPNPRNDDKIEIEIKYRINDGSGKSLNKLKVKLYWYNTMADVPQYLWDILNDRSSQGVFLRGAIQSGTEITNAAAKPRPPCVVIIAN
ncbi:MAG: hypothetical protein HZB42_13225 [Sphingobacteriales bacterium]|nr:hypothetical protein [Sphingobacteriales bacterium]